MCRRPPAANICEVLQTKYRGRIDYFVDEDLGTNIDSRRFARLLSIIKGKYINGFRQLDQNDYESRFYLKLFVTEPF